LTGYNNANITVAQSFCVTDQNKLSKLIEDPPTTHPPPPILLSNLAISFPFCGVNIFVWQTDMADMIKGYYENSTN